MLKTEEWFGEWFDSPYYHILYKNRDQEEAQAFIDKIAEHLHIMPQDKIMDLACGKGRHSIYLNKKGFDVVGLDLSPQNIEFARQFENHRLKFYVHDMREIWAQDQFNYIFNLFTSFGYFDTDEEHELAICSMTKSLVPGGILLIDFLNPYTVIHNLVPAETKQINGIEFHISKCVRDGYILKEIQFTDHGKTYEFQERVKAIRRLQFMEFFKKAHLGLKEIFGDYNLNPYVAESSERMIFVLQK